MVRIFASLFPARLESSVVFATFRPGGSGGGTPCHRGAYRLATQAVRRDFDAVRVGSPGLRMVRYRQGLQPMGVRKTIGVVFSQICGSRAGLEPEMERAAVLGQPKP